MRDRAVHAQAKEARKEWQAELEQRLKKVDREMDDLVSQADKLGVKEKNGYFARMAALQKQRTDTRQRYESLRKAPDEKWESEKDGVEQAVSELEAAWKAFVKELHSPPSS